MRIFKTWNLKSSVRKFPGTLAFLFITIHLPAQELSTEVRQTGNLLWETADSLNDIGSFESSIIAFQKAQQYYLEHNWMSKYVDAYNSIALNYSYLEDYEKAHAVTAEAILGAIKHLSATDTVLAKSFRQKAEIFMETGFQDSSIHYFEMARPVFCSAQNWEDCAWTEVGMSVNYFYKSDMTEMERALLRSDSMIQVHRLEQTQVFPQTYQLLGVLYSITGDFDKGLLVSGKALDIRLAYPEPMQDDSFLIARDLLNLGGIYFDKGDYSRALDYHARALTITEALGEKKEIPGLLQQIGLIHRTMQNKDLSLDFLNRELELLKELPAGQFNTHYVDAHHFLALNYMDSEQPEQALKVIHRALPYLNGSPDRIPYVYRTVGEILHKNGHYQQALDTLSLAEEAVMKTKGKLDFNFAGIYLVTGDVYRSLHNYDDALRFYQKGLDILSNAPAPTGVYSNPPIDAVNQKKRMVEFLLAKARVLFNRTDRELTSGKDLAFAKQTLDLATELVDIMRSEFLEEGSKQFLQQQSNAIYELAIEVSHALYVQTGEADYMHQAFGFAQKGKAILLLERLRDDGAKIYTNLPDTLLRMERDYKRDLSFYQKKLYEERLLADPDSLKMSVWGEKIFELKRSLGKLTTELEADYPDYFHQKYSLVLPAVEAIQQDYLNESQLYLEYFVGDSSIYLFRISKGGMKMYKINHPDDFEEMVVNFRNTLAQPPGASLQQAARDFAGPSHQLYQLLLSAALAAGPEQVQNLVIVPHGLLNFIPFEVLLRTPVAEEVAGFSRFDYLINTYPVSYSYAAGLLLNQRPDRRSGKLRCLAFAPSYGEAAEQDAGSGRITRVRGGQVDLPGAQREVEAISGYFSGDYFFGNLATERAFKENAPHYRLIHLAMHGAVNEENPLYSRLSFAGVPDSMEDQVLFAYEIYNLPLTADLVVLSACETGKGAFVHGEGVMSLAQGFLNTGVPAVTMSLWEAQDEATAVIMDYYYQGLARGLTKDMALRQAKMMYLETPASQKHPFFWAGFVTIGDNQALEKDHPLWLWGIAGIALFLLLMFLWKKKNLARFSPPGV